MKNFPTSVSIQDLQGPKFKDEEVDRSVPLWVWAIGFILFALVWLIFTGGAQ